MYADGPIRAWIFLGSPLIVLIWKLKEVLSQAHHHTYRKIYQEPHLRFNSKYRLDPEGRKRRGIRTRRSVCLVNVSIVDLWAGIQIPLNLEPSESIQLPKEIGCCEQPSRRVDDESCVEGKKTATYISSHPSVQPSNSISLLVLSHYTVMFLSITTLFAFSAAVSAHGSHQTPLTGPLQKLWYNTLPGDGGTQVSIRPLQTIIY